MKRKYDLIYSLGRDCACSEYLIRAGLRTYSGPFDWITGPKFTDRIDIILNDFEGFLNIEDLEPLDKNINPNVVDQKNDYYKNNRSKFHFYHDFSSGIKLEESFKGVKEKYNRRIGRFYKKIGEAKNVLLVYFTHYENIDVGTILDSCKKLENKFHRDIDFLIINHDESMAKGEVKKEEIAKNIEKYTLYTRDFYKDGILTVLGRYEDCDKIFKQFKLCAPFYRSRTFIKYFSRFITMFIPIKGWRKKLREKLKRVIEL